jgi:hypothetical protein
MRDDDRTETEEAERLAYYRDLVVRQADAAGETGWMEIDVPASIASTGKLRVPRGAFEQWAVSRCGGGHLAEPWKSVSPPGMKQMGDDVFHSDWMLGAGLDLDAMRLSAPDESLRTAAYDAFYAIQRRLLNFRCAVLLTGPFVSGRVFVPESADDLPTPASGDDLPPVVLLPNAGPDYLEVALEALDFGGAVIVEQGGEMAHLVTVLREKHQGPIVRVPKARAKYPAGAPIQVIASEGKVTLADEAFSGFANNSDPFGDGRRYIRTPDDDPLEEEAPRPGLKKPKRG